MCATGIPVTMLGALLEDEGESIDAMMLADRGVTIDMLIGSAFSISRVTRSENRYHRCAHRNPQPTQLHELLMRKRGL
jgi:hypothetical protein